MEMFAIIVLIICTIVIVLCFYFLHRNTKVREFCMGVLYYTPNSKDNLRLYNLLPSYYKILLSFKKLELYNYIPKEIVEEIVIHESKN